MNRADLSLGFVVGILVAALVMAVIGWAQPTWAHTQADLLTEIREARGDSIAENALLSDIAEERARQLTDAFGHNLDYITDRVPADWTVGAILAWNAFPDEASADAAVAQWLDSAGHEDILLGDWDTVGVGTADEGERHYFIAIFAKVGDTAPSRPTPTRVPRAPTITLPPTDTR